MKLWRWGSLVCLVGWVLLMQVGLAQAHANLLQASPAANSVLVTSPPEIRLWFSEDLEAQFSRFYLRSADGKTFDEYTSQLDPNEPRQLFMAFDEPLPDGVYTIVWRVISLEDGHPTGGSFSFAINDTLSGTTATLDTPIPQDSAALRALNLFSLALGVGSISFLLWVWKPSISATDAPARSERRLYWLMRLGWGLMGLSAVGTLWLQVSIAVGLPLPEAVDMTVWRQVLEQTRFGDLWLARMGLWVVLGVVLVRPTHRRLWLGLLIGLAILLTQSLNSHANSAQDPTPAVAADWLHLTATALWVGGLLQFANVLLGDRAQLPLTQLTARFSNYARLGVMALAVTGVYATWLQVGSLDALRETQYGQALAIKLVLFAPLLGIAALNLLITQRRLNAGLMHWGGYLQRLVLVEIGLAIAILGAVGVMTAIEPARNAHAEAQAQPIPPRPEPITMTDTADGMNIALQISSAWVGENTFTVNLATSDGDPITDASNIRLRFQNDAANIPESELNPTHDGNGLYRATGTSISAAGTWRIRLTIQRPNEFDTVLDFTPALSPAPPSKPAPPVDLNYPLNARRLMMLGVAVLLLVVGLVNMGNRPHQYVPSLGALAVAVIFGWGGIAPNPTPNLTEGVRAAKIVASTKQRLPYIIGTDGKIYEANALQAWQALGGFDGRVADLFYDEYYENLWVASDLGLYEYAGLWDDVELVAGDEFVYMHGYLFLLGGDKVMRGPDHWMIITPPFAYEPTTNLVMLSDHSHIIQSGSSLFRTIDLGLSWEPISFNDGTIYTIGITPDDQLLAVTDDGVQVWDMFSRQWRVYLPLPAEDVLPNDLFVFEGRVFAVAEGRIYRQAGNTWAEITPRGASVRSFSHADGMLWVLGDEDLWYSTDGETWQSQPIVFQ